MLMTALACVVVVWAHFYRDPFANLGAAPYTLVGISISIFMSFRNGACYERWWEGRKQWGHAIVEIRSFARESATVIDAPSREALIRGLCGFAHALAARLRGEDEIEAARPWVSDPAALSDSPNVANAILAQVGLECSRLAHRGVISDWRYMLMEGRLVGLSGVQAACERIKTTPSPFAYSLLIHRTAYLFCGLLPFGFVQQLGWMTPVLVTIISYTFFGLDALGNELEEPFARTENSLPLDAMVRTIERDALAALGVQPLPEPLEPVDFLLL